jgi:hypothetical protein
MAINFPPPPTIGEIYTDPASSRTWKWNGKAWEGIAGSLGADIEISDTAPTSPEVGDLWYDSIRGITYIYYFDGNSNQWVTVTSPSIETINLTGDVTATGLGDNLITTIEPNAASGFVGDSVTGLVSFDNSTNAISLTGIGLLEGLAVGDVVEVTGSPQGNNDKAFTVYSITDNSIVVNDAHAGLAWTAKNKSLVSAGPDTTITVTLACKAKNAPLGYGQAWVGVGADRGNGSFGIISTNSIGRAISVAVSVGAISVTTNNEPAFAEVYVDGLKITQAGVDNTTAALNRMTPVDFIVPSGSEYIVNASSPGGLNDLVIEMWKELR